MKFRNLSIAAILFLFIGLPAFVWAEGAESEETTQPVETEEAVQPINQSAIQIEDAVVCQDIVERAPIGGGDVFAKESAKLYCFSRVVGAVGETQITHNWYYKGTLKASVKLPVRSSNWRTWSSKSMNMVFLGEWMVEILSEDGTPLESIIFFIQ